MHRHHDRTQAGPTGEDPDLDWGKAEGPLLQTAARADGWMPTLITPSEYRTRWSRLREYVEREGCDMSSITGAVYLFAACGRWELRSKIANSDLGTRR